MHGSADVVLKFFNSELSPLLKTKITRAIFKSLGYIPFSSDASNLDFERSHSSREDFLTTVKLTSL